MFTNFSHLSFRLHGKHLNFDPKKEKKMEKNATTFKYNWAILKYRTRKKNEID